MTTEAYQILENNSKYQNINFIPLTKYK